jgi:hypothetical protein
MSWECVVNATLLLEEGSVKVVRGLVAWALD